MLGSRVDLAKAMTWQAGGAVHACLINNWCTVKQADLVIMTNDSPRGEAPNEIIADMVAGYPDSILKRNASVPYQPGFLQDPGRVDYNALEFFWHNCYECATFSVPLSASGPHACTLTRSHVSRL